MSCSLTNTVLSQLVVYSAGQATCTKVLRMAIFLRHSIGCKNTDQRSGMRCYGPRRNDWRSSSPCRGPAGWL
jgi:hypothetical protein